MYLFYLYFLGRARRLMHRLERAGIESVNMVCDSRIHDPNEDTPGEGGEGSK